MTLIQTLADAPVESIDEAIALMTAIDETLADTDGVKWFNRLYLRVTLSVRDAVHGAQFHDPAFLTKLDVVFANLYFSALAGGCVDSSGAPSAWRPLLEARHRAGVGRFQFALAGMNAHINRDLPEGIVRSFVELGGDPITGDLRERDFDSVNGILEQVEEQVKTEFTSPLIVVVDHLGGRVDDAVAMWKVRKARSTAWTNAQVLWGLRRLPRLRDRFFADLDGLVGLMSRGLLQPRDFALPE